MKRSFARVRHFLGTLAGGNVCEICGEPLPPGQQVICTACLVALPRTLLHRTRGNVVADYLSNAVAPVHIASSWFFYDPQKPVANLIRSSKYFNRPSYMRTLGSLYARELMAEIGPAMEAVDLLLPIPMHAEKEMDRGFNQARELAEGISLVSGIPVGDNLAVTRSKDTQTRRNYVQRHENVSGIFTLEHPSELEGLDIMLVDDVITTGATIAEAALTIGLSGARPTSISALSLALRP